MMHNKAIAIMTMSSVPKHLQIYNSHPQSYKDRLWSAGLVDEYHYTCHGYQVGWVRAAGKEFSFGGKI